MSPFGRLDRYTMSRKLFLRAWLVFPGVPIAVFFILMINDYRFPVILWIVSATFVGFYFWGMVMWHFLIGPLGARKRAFLAKQKTDSQARDLKQL